MCSTLALRKRTTMSVSVCAFGRCVNSRSSSLKCSVAESANVMTGNASRARAAMGCIGRRIHLRRAEALAHVFMRDDHRARLAEGIVAAGVIAVQVRVDHELHRLVGQHGDRGADLRRHVGELVVDDGGAIDAHREPDVAAAAHEHVDARRDADGFDLHVRRRRHGGRRSLCAAARAAQHRDRGRDQSRDDGRNRGSSFSWSDAPISV